MPGIQQNMIQINLFIKQKHTHRYRKQTYAYQKGKGGIHWEFGINIHTLLYLKQIANQDRLYSTGNYIQYLVITIMKKNLKKNMYIYTHCLHTYVHD